MFDKLNVGEYAKGLPAAGPLERKRQLATQEIISTIPNEPDQIDAIAAERGWLTDYSGVATYQTVKAYMDGYLDLDSTVKKLVEPIDHEYRTADYGQAIRSSEEIAITQRKLYSSQRSIR